MKYTLITERNIRQAAYAGIISFGLFILINLLMFTREELYFSGSILLYFIIIFELYVTVGHYENYHKARDSRKYIISHHKFAQFAHHFILPSILYFSIIAFTYFSRLKGVYFIMIPTTFFIFFILYQNVYSFYNNKFTLNKTTNYIYDTIETIIVFFYTYTILSLYINEVIQPYSATIIYLISTFVLATLVIIRHIISNLTLSFAFIMAFFMSVIFWFVIAFNINLWAASFIMVIIFHGYSMFVDHLLERKLTRDEVLDYLVILLLVFALITFKIGLSIDI